MDVFPRGDYLQVAGVDATTRAAQMIKLTRVWNAAP